MDRTVEDRWFGFSLTEQMLNIGNEVKRAIRFDDNSDQQRNFIDKAISYTELTISDPKNKKIRPELEAGRYVLEDLKNDHNLNCSKKQICDYYMNFMYLLK